MPVGAVQWQLRLCSRHFPGLAFILVALAWRSFIALKGAQGPFCLRTVSPVSNGLFCPCSPEPDFLSKELFIKPTAQWPSPKSPGDRNYEKGGPSSTVLGYIYLSDICVGKYRYR